MSERRLYPVIASIALISVAIAHGGTARAQEPRRVGVVVTTAINVSEDEADQLAAELGSALRDELAVDVIAGTESRRRLPPAGLPDDCVADVECRNDLGQRLDASELLMLVVVRVGSRIQIDATWSNVASGNTTSRPAVTLEAGADRAAVLAGAAPSLLPHIPQRTQPAGPAIVVVPTPQRDDGRHMTRNAWIAAGASGATLIGGTIFALSARNKFQALEDEGCRDTVCPQSDVDAMERHALAADVLFGVSIAAGVTALVFYLRSDGGGDAPAEDPPSVTVGAGPGDVGLAIGGRF